VRICTVLYGCGWDLEVWYGSFCGFSVYIKGVGGRYMLYRCCKNDAFKKSELSKRYPFRETRIYPLYNTYRSKYSHLKSHDILGHVPVESNRICLLTLPYFACQA
jgi:hypothetical protein